MGLYLVCAVFLCSIAHSSNSGVDELCESTNSSLSIVEPEVFSINISEKTDLLLLSQSSNIGELHIKKDSSLDYEEVGLEIVASIFKQILAHENLQNSVKKLNIKGQINIDSEETDLLLKFKKLEEFHTDWFVRGENWGRLNKKLRFRSDVMPCYVIRPISD